MPSQYFANENLPTNAPQVQQLPPDTQYGLDTAMLHRAIAQAMMQKGMQPLEGQTVVTGAGAPNHYVKPAITQQLASLANTGLGAAGMGQSMQEMLRAMQGYQGRVNQTEGNASGALSGSQPTGQPSATLGGAAPQPAAPLSQQLTAAYQAKINSGIPAMITEAQKLIPAIVEARNNENNIAKDKAVAAYGAGASVAQPGGLVEGANASGVGGAPLQAPGAPQTSMNNGVLTQVMPHTGQIAAVSENPLSTAMTKKVQDTNMGIITDRLKDAQAGQEDALASGNLAATARALKELVGRAQLGPQALERAELQRWGGMLGFPIPEGTTYSQLAHSMAMSLVSTAKAHAGLQGRISTPEWQKLLSSTGTDLDITAPALSQLTQNAEMQGNMGVANHNRRMTLFANHAKSNGLSPDIFNAYQVTPDMIAPVGTGESFMGQNTPPPSTPIDRMPASQRPARPPIDLRGQFPTGQ